MEEMKRVSRSKLYSWGYSVFPIMTPHLTLHRREISLFLHNNQSISQHSSFHSSHAKNEVLNVCTVHIDERKKRALYHSNHSIIQFQSHSHLLVLSTSPDLEANMPSSSFLLKPHPYNPIPLHQHPSLHSTQIQLPIPLSFSSPINYSLPTLHT